MIENSIENNDKRAKKDIQSHSSIIINNESVEEHFKKMHTRLLVVALGLTFLTAFGFLYLVASYQNMYFIQRSQCKSVFFGGFYFYFLNIFILMLVYLRNLQIDLFDPKQSLFIVNSFKQLIFAYLGQLFFGGLFFVAEFCYCSENLTPILIKHLIYQNIQFSLLFIINFIYYSKVVKEAEKISEEKEEQAKKRTIELFNASFALNETKSEVNYGVNRDRTQFIGKLEIETADDTSHFTTSCDNTKMVSVMSLESMFQARDRRKVRCSPRKLFHSNAEV